MPAKWPFCRNWSGSAPVEKCRVNRLNAKTLPDDRDEDVNGNSDPDLGLHGVRAGPIEGLDSEVLLDPL